MSRVRSSMKSICVDFMDDLVFLILLQGVFPTSLASVYLIKSMF